MQIHTEQCCLPLWPDRIKLHFQKQGGRTQKLYATIVKMSKLSLLSRGTGQVVKKKQEKLEVHFSPEDDLNWKSPETRCHGSRLPDDSQVVEGYWGMCLPKTYSTKTGALVLYSEDLAKTPTTRKGGRKFQRKLRRKSQALHIELHTLQDLARAILAYGGKQLRKDKKGMTWQPYLHFLSDPDIQTERQMRPGYSAKRYLLHLSRTWDPSILQKLQCAGYIKDPFLLEENAPGHGRKLQDLSVAPPKYNLLHIFCSPCTYLQTEIEEQDPKAVLGPSFHKQSENKAKLVEDYAERKDARGKVRVPLRISVRKLSFHLRPQHAKETTWSQSTEYKGIPKDRWAGIRQDGKFKKEDLDCNEIPKQSVDYRPLGSTSIETSEVWCEKSHVTFYGGFLPGRKIYSVTHKDGTNAEGRGGGPSGGTEAFPPIQPGPSSELRGVMKQHGKQVTEIFRLPPVSEALSRTPRKKLQSGDLSEELVILPLLVQLEGAPQAKARRRPRGTATVLGGKKAHGTCCNIPKSENDIHAQPLAPLPNDLILKPEDRKTEELPQITHGGISEASPGPFCLPPINKGQVAPSGRKTEACAEKDSEHHRECCSSTAPSRPSADPDREIICPLSLGAFQTTNGPEQFGLIPSQGGDGEIPHETRRIAPLCPCEMSTAVQEWDEKETVQLTAALKIGDPAQCTDKRLEPPQTQAGKQQRNRSPYKTFQNSTGSESIPVESRKGDQQNRDHLGGDSHLQPWVKETGSSTLPQTQSTEQTNFLQDPGKQLDDLPAPASLSHLEFHLSCPMMTASEKEISLDPDGTAVDRPDCGEEIKENVRMGIPSPAKLFGTEMATPSEKTSRRAQAASLETAGGVLENKAMARQKKREVAKTGAVSKVQKKKEKRPSHAEPVVGKSRPKRAVGKTVAYSKENSSHVKRSEAAEEPNQEKEKEGGSVELEPLDSLAEGDRGVKLNEDADEKEEKDGLRSPSDQSLPPSSPPEEEQPFLFGGRHPFTEDVAHTSASPAGPTDGPPLLRPPATSPTNGSQSDAVWSSGPAEDLPVNKAEGKQSRERIIMERAEKRRLAVERKRREQEELKRKEQEKQEREERMREEMEQERQRRVEEMRLKKLQLEEERQRQEEEAARRRYAEKAAEERGRQQQEEHRRKLLEMQKKKREEEQARAEAEKLRQKEREMWLKEEQQRIAEMAEEQRLEYEKRKQEEAEKAKCEAEERRKREEEEARIALEEAKKQALLLARQRAELEKQQQFQYKLLVEASGLERGQVISRPWVYSYFQLPFIKVGDDD